MAERRRTAWNTRRCSPRARAGWRRATRPIPKDVTVHEAGHQFWYGIVATNEFEHAWMDEGLNTFSTARVIEQHVRAELLRRSGTSAASCRGCSATLPLTPRRRRRSAGGYRTGARQRRAVDADVALLARHRRRDHLQQDRALAAHARAHARLGRRCSGSCRRTSRGGRSSIRSRQDFFAVATKSAAGT